MVVMRDAFASAMDTRTLCVERSTVLAMTRSLVTNDDRASKLIGRASPGQQTGLILMTDPLVTHDRHTGHV